MPAKKKSTSTLTRQRNAAHKAQREGRWETAIANYTRALAHKNLSADVKNELLESRASCYKKTGNLKAEALDLKTLSTLLKNQLEEKNEVLQQSQAELGILSSIAGALVDQADYESIGRLVGQKVQEFFNAEVAFVDFYNDRSGIVDVVYAYIRGELKQLPPFKYGQGMTSYVIKTRRPLSVATKKDFKKYGALYTEEYPSQSALVAPLISRKQALGSISIQDSKANAYSNHDLRILNAIAGSMSVALENARLFDEIQNSNREITETLGQQTATSDILRAMANSPTEIQPILDAVASNAARLCEASDVQIYSVEGDRLSQVAHFGPLPALQDRETLPLVAGLVVGRVVLERRTIQIEDARKLSKAEYPESVKLQQRLGHRTALATPLLRKGNAIGAIAVRRNEVRPFTEKQIALLATFADQAAIAIENVRLFEQLQTRNREISEALELQTATSDILQIIASSPENIDSVLSAIAEKAALLCNSADAVISYGEGGFLRVRAHYGPIPFLKVGERAGTLDRETVVGRAIIDGKPVQAVHNQKGKKSEFPIGDKFAKQFGYALTLAAPLLFQGKANGGIFVRRVEPVLFSEREISLLQSFANQAVIAIEKARLLNETNRLLEETTQRNREITEALELQTATSDILEIIASSPEDIDGVLSIIAEKAALLLKSEDAVIHYAEGDFFVTRAHYGPIPFFTLGKDIQFNRESVTGRAIIDRRPIQAIHNSKGKKSEFPLGDKTAKHFGYALTCAAPLLFQGKTIGAIMIRRVEPTLFSEKEISLLQNFANQAVIAIEKARLVNETNRLLEETTQRNREISEALELQTATSDILEVIASSPEDIDSVLSIIAEKAAHLLKSDDAVINYVEGGFFKARAHYGLIPFFKLGEGTPFNRETVTGRAIIDGRPIQAIYNVKGKKSEFPLGDKAAKQFGYAMTCAAPLLFQGKTIGAILIRRVEPTLFSEKDISLLQNFANHAVIAIEKARLLNETKRLLEETTKRNGELAVINSVQQGLASSLKFQEIVDLVGEKVGEIFNADTANAHMYDAHRDWTLNTYYVDRGRRIPFADGPLLRPSLTAVVADTRQPLLLGTQEEQEKWGLRLVPRSEKEGDQNESYLSVPILTGEKLVGVITVRSYQTNAFNQNDLRLLQTLANSMSVALENARLFDETAQRNAELAVINSVQEAMAQRTDIQGIYEAVGEKIRGIFGAQAMILGQFDHGSSLVLPHYFYEKGERLYPSPLPFTGLIKHLINTRQTIVINEDFETRAQALGMIIPAGEGSFNQNDLRQLQTFANSKSAVFVPLVAGDKVIGGISLQNADRENAFSDSDVRLLETLANSMSVALENARLFAETAQRNAELAVINSMQAALAKELNIQGIYEAVGEKIREIFDAQGIGLFIYDPKTDMLHFPYISEKGKRLEAAPRPLRGFSAQMKKTGKSILVNENFAEKAREVGAAVIAGDMPKSGAYAPIQFHGKFGGTLGIENIDREHAFTEADVRLLETLANSMSVALENARLFDETAQRNAELAVINSVQEALAKQTDIKGIYEAVGEKIKDIFDAQSVILGTFDRAASLTVYRYVYEKGERFYPDPRPQTRLGRRLSSIRKTLVINEDFDAKGKRRGMTTIGEGPPSKSGVWVPLVAGDKVIGNISLQNIDRENAFSESDVRLLETLALSMSVTLENARLFDETAQRNAELAVINSVQQGLASRLKFQEIVDLVGDKVGEIFKADTVNAAMYDAQRDWFINAYYVDRGRRISRPDGPRPRPSLSAAVVDTRQPLLLGTQEEQKKQGAVSIPRTEEEGDQNESVLFVPILAGEKVIGVISVQSYQKNAFNQNDMHLLQTLANSMSVALENARLFDETSQRNAELAVINTVQAALADELDIQTIYDTVGEKLREIFHVGAITINIYDLDANTNSYVYGFEDGQRTPNLTVPINDMHHFALEQGNTFLVNEGFQEFADRFGAKAPQGKLPKSALWVQLPKRGNRVTAVTLMDIEHENAFSQSDVRLLETLASSMSAALENARLFDESNRLLEETQVKAAELTTINTVGQALASELDLDSLIQLIGEQVRNIFKADIAYLAIYDKADGMIRFPYIQGETLEPLKLGEGIVSQIIRTAEPLLINRDEGWKEAERNVDRVGVKAKSYLGVPILVGKSAIGAISVQSTQKEGRFDAADMNLLSTIAANVASAIENARLFAEVARQKEYFETFFQYSPAAVVVVDFNGNVISWNPAAESLFGYTAQEAIGKDVDDLVAKDPRVEAEARRNTQKFIGERGRVEVKGRRTRKDGSLVDVEVKGLPISVEGEMVGLLVIYHDISEIEQARRAAEEANQAKSAFLANMSHELRTPLNAIIGFTRIVRRKGDDSLPEKQLENLDKVLVSAEHLLGLINTILDIAKIEAGRMELQLSDFDLAALIDSCLATTQPLVKSSDIKLIKSMPPGLPRMHSDQEKIRQILLNLLSNAAKFTHAGSIEVVGKLTSEVIVLSVEDSGIGIAEENLHKIFEEFQQADNTTTRQYGGTGLGLSISRSLARLLGGDLTASSVEGEGSTFSLTIPLHLGKPGSGTDDVNEAISQADIPLEPDKPLVLVIDDQPDMFHILQQNLEGYQIVGALSGEEGIEKARTLHPTAITLDIMMPRKDGWQVLHELKNDPETRDIPVIILTIVDNKAMGFRLGASDYLVKPLNEKLMREALERVTKSNGGVRPRRLLVVDDDPQVIDLIQQMFQGQDFSIAMAKDGAEALARIRQSQPDVILLDLVMPKLDGFQFIHEVQKKPKLRKIPIIVLTAKSLSNEELSRLQKSVATIVKKQGLDSEALIKEIQKVIV